MRRVVVTGLGAVTPLGVGVAPTWSALLAGRRAIRRVPESLPDAVIVTESCQKDAEMRRMMMRKWDGVPSRVAGCVPRPSPGGGGGGGGGGSDADTATWNPTLLGLSAADQRRMSQFAQYAVVASDEALRDAGWRPSTDEEREATGVCMGSGIGNLEELCSTALDFASRGYHAVSPLFVPRILINLAAGHVAMRHGLRGPNHAATTACTTGAHSVGDAFRFIGLGDADVMLAGGTEACVHPLTFAGFAKGRSLSTAHLDSPSTTPAESSCRPFDADRDGFVVAEGAAVLVLEALDHAVSRGARIYAEVKGYGCSADAHHVTAPLPDGSGALSAMRRALRQAGVRPRDIGYVNAHATGTRVGDRAEAAAIRALMMHDAGVDGVEKEEDVCVSSTKGAIGHLLGAAGAVEAMFSVLAIIEVCLALGVSSFSYDRLECLLTGLAGSRPADCQSLQAGCGCSLQLCGA